MSTIRMTGMASGLDTDSIVEQLMQVEKQQYYKAQREEQKIEWKIEKYREITTKLTDFSNKYLDILSSTNMKSGSFFRKYTTTLTSSLTGKTTNAVSIISTSDAKPGSHTVSIKQVAERAEIMGQKTTGLIKADGPTINEDGTISFEEGKTVEVTIDGKTKNIELDTSYTSIEDFTEKFETKLTEEFGTGYDNTSGKVDVSIVDGNIHMQAKNGASNISVYDVDNLLNFKTTSSTLTTSKTLEELTNSFNAELKFTNAVDDVDGEKDQIRFKINDVEFEFDKETSLKDIIQEINNNDEIDVTLEYNSTSGAFKIYTDNTGAAEEIQLEDLGDSNFFEALGFETGKKVSGKDTLALVDGVEVARSTKSFTVDGVTYQANDVTQDGEEVTINFETDTEAIYESIKTFVDEYNGIVDYLQGIVDEDYDRDYPPLTDDEKAEMTEDEIEKWEAKAKTGLLSNDSIVESLLRELRSTFSQTVDGVTTTFSDIGIKTGTYTNGGKIMLDEQGISNLKAAISDNLETVVALFTQKSTTHSATSSRSYTSDQRAVRTAEEGLMHRFSDVLENYISTYRDSSNQKGKLLEKAGKKGDTTETTSILSKQLLDYDDKVRELLDKVNSRYEKYYKQFSALETAMNSLNSQSSYIASMLGGGTQA